MRIQANRLNGPLHVRFRCQCFYGPKCPSSVNDPCGSYSLPPPFPGVFSTFYTQIVKICDNKGCTNYTNIGELLQDAKAGLQRHDKIGLSWETTFIFPFAYIENKHFLQVCKSFRSEYKYDHESAGFCCSHLSRSPRPRFLCSVLSDDNSGILARKKIRVRFTGPLALVVTKMIVNLILGRK